MKDIESSPHPSPARAARRFLVVLIALAVGLIVLLLNIAANSEGLWSHVYHFCLLAWNALGEHLVYLSQMVLLLLPCIGISLLLIEVLSQVWHTRRAVLRLRSAAIATPARLQEMARRLDIETRMDVVETTQPVAFCYGLWTPRILITTGLLKLFEDDELNALLIHERTHLRSRDPLQLLASRALARGMFFLQIARDLASAHELAQEIVGDAEVVQILGERSALASALLKLLATRQDHFYSTLAVGGFSHVDARIEYLAEPGRRVGLSPNYFHVAWSGIFAVLLVVAVLSTLSVTPVALPLDPDCVKQWTQTPTLPY